MSIKFKSQLPRNSSSIPVPIWSFPQRQFLLLVSVFFLPCLGFLGYGVFVPNPQKVSWLIPKQHVCTSVDCPHPRLWTCLLSSASSFSRQSRNEKYKFRRVAASILELTKTRKQFTTYSNIGLRLSFLNNFHTAGFCFWIFKSFPCLVHR